MIGQFDSGVQEDYRSPPTPNGVFYRRGKFSHPASGDLSFRVSHVAGDWLFYGRAGFGITYLKETDICRGAACFDAPAGMTRQVDSRYRTDGYATIGLGVERNIGAYFARLEAEFLPMNRDKPEEFHRSGGNVAHFNAALGFRF